MTIKNYTTIFILITIFSGCIGKMYDKKVMDDTTKTAQRLANYKTDHLEKVIKQVEYADKDYFYLNENYDLNTIMKKLSRIDNNVYFVKIGKNIMIPPSDIKIRSFEQLKKYVKLVTDLDLKITKNRFIKSLPKVVELTNNDKSLLSLKDIRLKFSGTTKFEKLIDYINETTQYSIFLNKQSFKKPGEDEDATDSEDGEILIEDQSILSYQVTMNNWTLARTIGFFKNSLNLYVDISYKEKTIILSKYKTNTFSSIILPNINIAFDDKLAKDVESAGGGTSSTETTLYKILEQKVRNVLVSYDEDPKNANIDILTGALVVTCSSEALKVITNTVNNFNSDLSKQAYIRVSYYEIILNRDHSMGVDFGKSNLSGINLDSRVGTNFLYKTVSSGKWTWFTESLHEFGEVYNVKEYNIALTNNIPFEDNDLITTKYLASTDTTKAITNGVSELTRTYKTDEYQDGYAVKYLAKIRKNNMVSLKMNITEKSLEDLKKKEFGLYNDTFTFPSVKKVSKSPLIQLNMGEKIIVWQRKKISSVDSYSGRLPLEDFIIGGKSGKKYVLKENLLFIELIKIKQ